MRKDVRETDAFTLCPVVKAPYTTSDGGTVRSTLDDATTLPEALGKSGVTNLFTDTAVFSVPPARRRSAEPTTAAPRGVPRLVSGAQPQDESARGKFTTLHCWY